MCVFELTFKEKRDPRTLDVVRIRLSQLSAWAPAGKLLECAGVSLSVSFAADVANYRGFVWAVDGCTQPTDMHIDTAGLRNEFTVPYILDKSCARQQLAAPLHRLLEQLEFARTQINRAGATLRSAIDEIELQ